EHDLSLQVRPRRGSGWARASHAPGTMVSQVDRAAHPAAAHTGGSMTGPVAEVPVGRYGPAPRRGARRRRVVTLWLLGLAGLAVALWIGMGAARTPVNWQDVGFSIDGAESVEV